jgi:hypothetical protein
MNKFIKIIIIIIIVAISYGAISYVLNSQIIPIPSTKPKVTKKPIINSNNITTKPITTTTPIPITTQIPLITTKNPITTTRTAENPPLIEYSLNDYTPAYSSSQAYSYAKEFEKDIASISVGPNNVITVSMTIKNTTGGSSHIYLGRNFGTRFEPLSDFTILFDSTQTGLVHYKYDNVGNLMFQKNIFNNTTYKTSYGKKTTIRLIFSDFSSPSLVMPANILDATYNLLQNINMINKLCKLTVEFSQGELNGSGVPTTNIIYTGITWYNDLTLEEMSFHIYPPAAGINTSTEYVGFTDIKIKRITIQEKVMRPTSILPISYSLNDYTPASSSASVYSYAKEFEQDIASISVGPNNVITVSMTIKHTTLGTSHIYLGNNFGTRFEPLSDFTILFDSAKTGLVHYKYDNGGNLMFQKNIFNNTTYKTAYAKNTTIRLIFSDFSSPSLVLMGDILDTAYNISQYVNMINKLCKLTVEFSQGDINGSGVPTTNIIYTGITWYNDLTLAQMAFHIHAPAVGIPSTQYVGFTNISISGK